MAKPPAPPDNLLSARPEFAGVPYIDQYVGAWALWEPHVNILLGQAQSLNVQLHLEQHFAAGQEPKAAVMAVSGNVGLNVVRGGIAVVELRGTLMKQASSFSAGSSTVMARRQIRAAAADDQVAGILLVIDSPGGTVAGTEDLAADLRAAANKKPIFAHIEDLGASAAYWQASQTHRIAAGSSALVGSIGVFSVVADMSKRAEDQGVKVHVVRFGAFKGAGTPGTEITEDQLARWQRIVDAHGDDFVATVARGRRISEAKARELADGDIHKGESAKKLGLVDAIESLDETLEQLISETKKPRATARTKSMSEQGQLVAAELKSSAATLAELKENCPGASSDFLLAQIEKAATLPQAMKAHAAQLAEEKAALAKERDELKAKADEAAKVQPKKTRGVEPLGDGGKSDETVAGDWEGGANAFCAIEIAKLTASGITREKAAAHVFKTNPGLREAMVAEANEKRPQRRAG